MKANFNGLAALAALGLALSALAVPTSASAAPIVRVGIFAPAIVATTPRVSVTLGRPLSPGPNWDWVDGYWAMDGHGHSTWMQGYWDWSPPPVHVVTVHRPAPVVVRHQHRAPSRPVIVHRR